MSTIKTKIMQEATKLFINQGYLATSVQDIVTQSGVSKGSFYNYFKSKEELTYHLFRYHREQLRASIHEVEAIEHLTDRECFAMQLEIQLRHMFEHRELIQIALQYLNAEKELTRFFNQTQLEDLEWTTRQLLRIYGTGIEEYVIDCATILTGITIAYSLNLCGNNKQPIDVGLFVQYVLRRLDAIVGSFDEGEKPLFTKQIIDDLLRYRQQETTLQYDKVKTAITILRDKLSLLKLDNQHTEKILNCLSSLEEEFINIKQKPREHICEGLLLYLAKQKLPSLETELQQLTQLIRASL